MKIRPVSARLLVLLLCCGLFGCTATPSSSPALTSSAQSAATTISAFFAVYAQRQDLDKLMDFYAEGALLQDLVYGNQLVGKSQIRGFYRWGEEPVQLLEEQALAVTEQVVQGNIVVTRGIFKPFMYHQQRLGPWRFMIWHELNSQGKIIKQYDWINYTPKEMFVDGDNLNLQ